jgi:hypothetical protein
MVLSIRVPDPHQFELLDPDPHSNSGSGSGSRRAKMTHKNRKDQNFHVFKYWMFSFEG